MIRNAKIVSINTDPQKYGVETKQRGELGFTVRAHVLFEILRNAKRWVRGYESPQSKALRVGSLFDCLLLTPQRWHDRYCTTPPTYTGKDGETKKWRNDLRIAEVAKWHKDHEGLEIVSQDESASAHAAVKRLSEDPLITELIGCSQKQVMITAEWHDAPTGLVVPMKCLVDLLPDYGHPVFGNTVWDVKTTQNATPYRFGRDAERFGYEVQAAFYLAMVNAATGQERDDFGHVVIESFPPYEYRTPPPLLSKRFLDFGRLLYLKALSLYCRCIATGEWPSYDTGPDWPKTDCSDYHLDMTKVYDPIDEEEEDEEEVPEMEQTADLIP